MLELQKVDSEDVQFSCSFCFSNLIEKNRFVEGVVDKEVKDVTECTLIGSRKTCIHSFVVEGVIDPCL